MSGRGLGLAAAIAVVGLGWSAGMATAADDGYQNVFSSVLQSVGVLSRDPSPDIDYRERPSLVLPPKMDLPKPANADAPRTAAWPQDQDVIDRRKAEADAHRPLANILGNRDLKASREELNRGRVAGVDTSEIPESAARQARCGQNGNNRSCLVVNPDELKAENDRYIASGLGEKKDLQPGEEPERVWLTQPPKGYLKVQRVVKATAEAPKQKIDESRPSSSLIYRDKPDDE